MNQHFMVRLLAALLALGSAGLALAQEVKYPEILDAKPMFITLPNRMQLAPATAGTSLKQWNGSFTDLTGRNVAYTMVGTKPSAGSASTTIPVYIIPIKMVYGSTNGNHTFSPSQVLSNGKTVINNIIASPIFNPGVNFTQGGTNLGTTQYLDAYQRANFWKYVHTFTGYHVLLGKPTVLATQTINVSASLGTVMTNPFGGSGIVGTYDVNAFDSKLQSYITKFTQINPGVLPLFLTYDIYLTGQGCCIGGYHSANAAQPGGQTYAYSTYVDTRGAFSQDVSALSHEIGEWMDDPFVNNRVHCKDNSIMENGDPLVPNVNFGAFPYSLGGFTYNLQSLVFIGYFGAPKSTSVHSWLAFQNDEAHVCPGQ
jgi:hypothetical protein